MSKKCSVHELSNMTIKLTIYNTTNTNNTTNNTMKRNRSETMLCCDNHKWVGSWSEFRHYGGCPLCRLEKIGMNSETIVNYVTVQMCHISIN